MIVHVDFFELLGWAIVLIPLIGVALFIIGAIAVGYVKEIAKKIKNHKGEKSNGKKQQDA